MGARLDLNKAHLTRKHGDLLAVFTWVNDERALALIPAYRQNASWYIVLDSAAYKYDDPRYLANQCRIAAEVLGMEPSTNNWFRLANIIHDALPDLIGMPSAPDATLTRASYGEMKLMADGKLLSGQEIRFDVDSGATYG